MKTIKIYAIIATIIIIGLFVWIYSLKKELRETEEVLEECSDRYYDLIGK